MIYRLKNTVQHYAWGSKTFIPELLRENHPSENPCAELWMGDHPRAPSLILTPDGTTTLSQLIQEDPEKMLGNGEPGALPFLFKVLAAAHPLSIQVHPGKDQARKGYNNENAAGVQPDAFDRNFKDPRHKPELICALTPFDAMSGFREPGEIAGLITHLGIDRKTTGAAKFSKYPDENSLRIFFRWLLNLSNKQKSVFLAYLFHSVTQAKIRTENDELTFDWTIKLLEYYPDDIGAFAPILLNTVRLQPGEALYMDSGILHAYLKGAGIEIMANSDNVLRGGLTSKHVDIPELFKALIFTGAPARIIRPESADNIEFIYPTPAREFQLSRIELNDSQLFESKARYGAEIILAIDGIAKVTQEREDQELSVKKGEAIFIPFVAGEYTIQGEATLYRAALPLNLREKNIDYIQ